MYLALYCLSKYYVVTSTHIAQHMVLSDARAIVHDSFGIVTCTISCHCDIIQCVATWCAHQSFHSMALRSIICSTFVHGRVQPVVHSDSAAIWWQMLGSVPIWTYYFSARAGGVVHITVLASAASSICCRPPQIMSGPLRDTWLLLLRFTTYHKDILVHC